MSTKLWVAYSYCPASNLDSVTVNGVYDSKSRAIKGILNIIKNSFEIYYIKEGNDSFLAEPQFNKLTADFQWADIEIILKKNLEKNHECEFREFVYYYTNVNLNKDYD